MWSMPFSRAVKFPDGPENLLDFLLTLSRAFHVILHVDDTGGA